MKFGKEAIINLYGCKGIDNKENIRSFLKTLVLVIKMKAHGDPIVDRFGEGTLEGISGFQFIETSSITIHCDEIEDRVFLNIFSCKDFNPDHALNYCIGYFEANNSTIKIYERD